MKEKDVLHAMPSPQAAFPDPTQPVLIPFIKMQVMEVFQKQAAITAILMAEIMMAGHIQTISTI
jgi:hypothetical protein